jgi:hypothetical protein
MTAFNDTERTAIADSVAMPGHAPASMARAGTAVRHRALLALAAAAGVLAAWLLAPLAPQHAADPDLGRLLAAMGLIKGAIVAAAAAVLFVRFRWPVSPAVAAGYLGAVSVAAFAAAMIAQLAWVGASALAFHAAALVALALAVVDGRNAPEVSKPTGANAADPAGAEMRRLLERLRHRREA